MSQVMPVACSYPTSFDLEFNVHMQKADEPVWDESNMAGISNADSDLPIGSLVSTADFVMETPQYHVLLGQNYQFSISLGSGLPSIGFSVESCRIVSMPATETEQGIQCKFISVFLVRYIGFRDSIYFIYNIRKLYNILILLYFHIFKFSLPGYILIYT